MAQADAARIEARYEARDFARDAVVLLGFSVAIAITRGFIKTSMALPGHSAVFWIPVLVLAGCYRRPGLTVGSALLGGTGALALGKLQGNEFAGLMASAAVVEALGLGGSTTARGLRMLVAGILGHLGKLGVKVLMFGVAGLPLNKAGLTLYPTLALYAAFGLAGGAIAWGLLSAWLRLSRAREDRETPDDPA